MIRIAVEADVPAMLAIYAPYILNTAYSFEYEVPTEAAFLQRFRKYTEGFPWLVWEENGEVLGYAYGSAPFERAAYGWCAESSIYLRPDAQGRGIGRRLYGALEALLQYQGYRVLYAIITSENTGSLCFHSRAGFAHVAQFPRCGWKFGRWVGTVWMEKRLNFVESPSNMPVPWSAIVADVQKMADILDTLSLS